MNRIFASALVASSLLLGLTACSNELSTDAAAKKYLQAVCAVSSPTDEVVSAIRNRSVTGVTAGAAKARDAYQNISKTFSDKSVVWPASVKPLVETMASDSQAVANVYDSMSKVTSMSGVASLLPSMPSISDSASAEIRTRLNIPTTADGGCSTLK